MAYRLIRPCKSCPFRTDIRPYLTAERVQDLSRELERGVFCCHETVDYDRWQDDDEGDSAYVPSGNEEHCAGALILLEKVGRPSQIMRVAERLHREDGAPIYDRRRLDMSAPIFDSFEAMEEAQRS